MLRTGLGHSVAQNEKKRGKKKEKERQRKIGWLDLTRDCPGRGIGGDRDPRRCVGGWVGGGGDSGTRTSLLYVHRSEVAS